MGLALEKPSPITEAQPDNRRDLVEVFLDRIIESSADGFLFENVKSILHPRNINIVKKFISRVESSGYKCSLIKANAAEYGVPQLRERVFILGAKNSRPGIPSPTHYAEQKDCKYRKPFVTAGEALKDFCSDVYFEPEEVVSGKWEKEFKEIPPGWNYKALSAWAGHPNPIFEAETRFWNFLLKLSPNKPSWTIAANPGPWTGPFHWDNRRLRTVEIAALQTFPTNYVFFGNRKERVKQIGNAAPPHLIKQMVEKVFEAINASSKKKVVI
jgi:DNA (cytosine-5)-methyltransferase 1